MSVTDVPPRSALIGVVGVWIAAIVLATGIGIVAPPDWRAAWMAVGLGVAIILSFAVQLAYARSSGFIVRVAASALGSMVAMGLVGVGFGLATLFAG